MTAAVGELIIWLKHFVWYQTYFILPIASVFWVTINWTEIIVAIRMHFHPDGRHIRELGKVVLGSTAEGAYGSKHLIKFKDGTLSFKEGGKVFLGVHGYYEQHQLDSLTSTYLEHCQGLVEQHNKDTLKRQRHVQLKAFIRSFTEA